MRVVLRADSGQAQGTGHVMRCVTLAERLRQRGHDPILMTAPIRIPWLREHVASLGISTRAATAHRIDVGGLASLRPDWIVVDSYEFDPVVISELSQRTNVLMITDADARGAHATLYLDQNLGATGLQTGGEELLGADFALVRNDITSRRRVDPHLLRSTPARLAVVLGGTDPRNLTLLVGDQLAGLAPPAAVIVVAQPRQFDRLAEHSALEIVGPTTELPAILASADVVISAAGTSAWDVCTLGVPSMLLAVVDNQRDSLRQAVAHGVALGIDVSDDSDHAMSSNAIAASVERLITDASLRDSLSSRCAAIFDGMGADRVVDAIERRSGKLANGG